MRKFIRESVFLAGTCFMASLSGHGQAPRRSVDIGVTYDAERAYIAPGRCNCFWLNGGGVDVATGLWKGLGVAASFTGDHASNVSAGVDVSKISYMAGPRYTYVPWRKSTQPGMKRGAQVFGEALFGGTHGFSSTFSSANGVTSSANSFAMQLGGGVHLPVSRHIAIRVIQAGYVRTLLPNNGSNVQNDLRLGAGVVYHLGVGHRVP